MRQSQIRPTIRQFYLKSNSKVEQTNRNREPWSSGYGRRLTSKKSWVRILVPDTGWAFFSHLFVVKIVMCVWKDDNKWKGGRGWPIIFFKKTQIEPDWTDLSPSWINRQICTKRTIYYCLNFWLFGFFFPKRFSFWTRSLVRLFYSSESVRQADASARTTHHSRLLHAYFKIIGLKKFFKNVKFINFVVWNINIYFKLLNGHLERIKCKFKKSLLKYNIGRYVKCLSWLGLHLPTTAMYLLET